MKVNEFKSLVLWIDGNTNKYVVCSYYNPTKREGEQWCWGHYFHSLEDALEYVHECKKGFTYSRAMELLEQSISFIFDEGEGWTFCEDRDIEFTNAEEKYFWIGNFGDDEDE